MFGSDKKGSKSADSVNGNISTIVAEDCVIEGSINNKSFIKIDGQVIGDIQSDGGVILGNKGYVKGDVKTKELIVFGKIDGKVVADTLFLKQSGVINGDMDVVTMQVDAGAVYRGSVAMSKANLSTSQSKDKTVK